MMINVKKTIPTGYIPTAVENVRPGDVLHAYGKVEDVFANPYATSDSDVAFVFTGWNGDMRVEDFSHIPTVEVLKVTELSDAPTAFDITKLVTPKRRNRRRPRSC